MRFLHTSDWHLGQQFFYMKREREHRAFLQWLVALIQTEQIELVLLAGDVFDTGTPANYALQLYYDFLRQAHALNCQVIVVGGNHDSAATLNAPSALLDALKVTVVGDRRDPAEAVIPVKNDAGEITALVCAVPFLREGEVRTLQAGEHQTDKNRGLIEGIANYYQEVVDYAVQWRGREKAQWPILATGHLYAAGATVTESERDIYVGTLEHFPGGRFPSAIDYLALGHLHKPQKVGGEDTKRYCGTPIPMSFAEARQPKQVIIGDFQGSDLTLQEETIPEFQALRIFTGDLSALELAVNEATLNLAEDEEVWAEFRYQGDRLVDLKKEIDALCDGRPVKPLVVKDLNRSEVAATLVDERVDQLADLQPQQVFERRLQDESLSTEDEAEIMLAFLQTLAHAQEVSS